MVLTQLILILFFNIYLIYVFYKRYSRFAFWTNPLALLLVYWFFNYPVKALFIFLNDDYSLSDRHLVMLMYYVVFLFVLVSAFNTLFKLDRLTWTPHSSHALLSKLNSRFVIYLFMTVIVSYSFKVVAGTFYTYSEFVGDRRNIVENILLNLGSLHFLSLTLVLYLALNKSKYYFYYVGILFFFSLYDSLVSSSKAPIFYVLVACLFTFNMSGKRIPRLLFVGLLSTGIVLFYFSYAARFSGSVVQERVGLNVVDQTLESMSTFNDGLNERIIDSIISRFELLDNLMVLDERYYVFPRGSYEYGSIVELGNMIPRLLLPDRPVYAFNEFVQEKIIGYGMKGTTMSIGRIGEAYYLLGYFGIIFAVFYAVLYERVYKIFFIRAVGPLSILIYIRVYYGYIILDNYMFENLFSLVFTMSYLYLLYMLTHRRGFATSGG